LYFSDRVSLYVAQAGLKLLILLPQPLEFWDHRFSPPILAPYHVLIEERTEALGDFTQGSTACKW
jgi:hypothetical protein